MALALLSLSMCSFSSHLTLWRTCFIMWVSSCSHFVHTRLWHVSCSVFIRLVFNSQLYRGTASYVLKSSITISCCSILGRCLFLSRETRSRSTQFSKVDCFNQSEALWFSSHSLWCIGLLLLCLLARLYQVPFMKRRTLCKADFSEFLNIIFSSNFLVSFLQSFPCHSSTRERFVL